MPKPILPVLLMAPHWMSLPPPECSLPSTVGRFQELPAPFAPPSWVVLTQKARLEVPSRDWVESGVRSTRSPLSLKLMLLPDVLLRLLVIKLGSWEPPALSLSFNVPLCPVVPLRVVLLPWASLNVHCPLVARVRVGALASLTGVRSRLAEPFAGRLPSVTL